MLKGVDFPHEKFPFDVVLESISEPRKGDRRVFTNSTLKQIVVKLLNVLTYGFSFLMSGKASLKRESP